LLPQLRTCKYKNIWIFEISFIHDGIHDGCLKRIFSYVEQSFWYRNSFIWSTISIFSIRVCHFKDGDCL